MFRRSSASLTIVKRPATAFLASSSAIAHRCSSSRITSTTKAAAHFSSAAVVTPTAICQSRHASSTGFDTLHPMHEKLHGLITKARIVVFLTGTPMEPQCGFTMRMVDLLEQLPIQYEFVNIMEDDAVCEGLKAYSGWPTYPQMYIDGELVGGYDITRQMMMDGSLVKMLDSKGLLIK